MARTFGGLLFYNASQLNFIQAAGTVAYTRNAAGDISVNVSASSTVQAQIGLADLKRPFFAFPEPPGMGTIPVTSEFQSAFGTAVGGPSNPFSGGLGGQLSQFGTPAIPWGVAVVDVFAVYSVGTNPLTTATIGLYRQTYAESVATVTTTLVNAVAMTAAATASAVTTHVFKSTLAQPIVFEGVDNTDLVCEVILAVPAGGTARLYGMGFHVAAEYS